MLKNIKKSGNFAVMKIKYKSILSIFAFFILILPACINTEKIAPALPPIESISIDLTYFNLKGEESTYFNDATEGIIFWQILLTDSLSFQKDLLERALTNNLEYQADETWLIKDKLNYDEESYDILLFCINYTDTVNSKLYFSLDTTYINLLTFEGISYNSNSQGNWIINKPEKDTSAYVKFLTTNWKIDSSENKEIKFTNFLSGGDNGNYILYKDSTDDLYNSYIDLYDKANENHTIIQWNSISNVGRIKDYFRYADDEWYCWDDNFFNIECNK